MEELLSFKGCLKPLAFDSAASAGRRHEEDEDAVLFGLIDPFVLDCRKVINSKLYRRLARKTQVFPAAKNVHLRNRLIHTEEVVSFASTVAEILGLNVGLTAAIAYAHDLGHAPFGHAGERKIAELTGLEFRHEKFGMFLVNEMDRKGKLNLCYETILGQGYHSRGGGDLWIDGNVPAEFNLVMLADKLAYFSSDVSDCLRKKYLTPERLPAVIRSLGENQREQTAKLIFGLVQESAAYHSIHFSDSEIAFAYREALEWMHFNVYSRVDHEEEHQRMFKDLERAYWFLSENQKSLNVMAPGVILAMLTDDEVLELSAMQEHAAIKDLERAKQLAIFEFDFGHVFNRSAESCFDPQIKVHDFKKF